MKKSTVLALTFAGLSVVPILYPLEAYAKNELLKHDECRHAQGWSEGCVTFKGNTTLELSGRGGVITGILGKDACMRAQGWSEGCTVFKAGTRVTFNEKGGVVAGTLANDANLRPEGLGTAKTYKAGTTVTFTGTGHVAK
jgi:hypothetical protein